MTPKLVAVEIIALLPNLIKSSGREAAGETNNLLEIKFYFNINILGNEYSTKTKLFLNRIVFSRVSKMYDYFFSHHFFPYFYIMIFNKIIRNKTENIYNTVTKAFLILK